MTTFDLEDVLTEIMVDELTIMQAITKYHLSDEESILLCFALAEMSVINVKL